MIYTILVKGEYYEKEYNWLLCINNDDIIYNIILKDLKIGGLLYQIFIIALIVLNIIILIKFRKRIKLKGFIIAVYFFIWFLFSMPLLFVYFLAYGTDISEESGRNDIYDDMHYFCENNYEVYSYSASAMDSFHYSIGKHYEFLDIDGMIYIPYNERNEVSQEEYDYYLNTHNCRMVGEVNESK